MSVEKERKVRKARRVELRCTLGFSSGEVEGGATITNISTAGCRAESDINMAEGLDVRVALQLPDQSPPVKVERASVRWVSAVPLAWASFCSFRPSEPASAHSSKKSNNIASSTTPQSGLISRSCAHRASSCCTRVVNAGIRETPLLVDNRHRHLNSFVR